MSASSTQLPSASTLITKRPTRPRANATAPTVEKPEEYTDEMCFPSFFYEMEDPSAALTYKCDIHGLFGDNLITFENPSAHDKKKSIRKLLALSDTKQKTDNLTAEQYRNIADELNRLVAHSVNFGSSFMRIFHKVTKLSLIALTQMRHMAQPLALDRTVASHPRLQTLNLFNTGFFVDVGHAFTKMCICIDSMKTNTRKVISDERYNKLIHASGAYLATFPLKIEVLREGIPSGWQLHPDTNTPLTDFEIQEQNNRINSDFLFLCIGILVTAKQEETARQSITRALVFCDT
jgi:hypothetical protein